MAWTLTDSKGAVIQAGTGTLVVPVTTDGLWHQLDLPLNIDLSSDEARRGTLRIREVNDGSLPVLFDSLTITHPQDQVLVTQEQHYYPLGMAMSGVAVNTLPAVNISKAQFNGGSELQDDLLGAEAGVYSTFFRTYDPATGRFTGVDPLADQYADWTPYQFALGNPIAVNDPTGALTAPQYQDILNQLWAEASRSQATGGGGAASWSATGGFTGPGTFSSDGHGGFSITTTHEALLTTGGDKPISYGSGQYWTTVQPINIPQNNAFTNAYDDVSLTVGVSSNIIGITSIAASQAQLEVASVRTLSTFRTAAKFSRALGYAGLGLSIAGAVYDVTTGNDDTHTWIDLGVVTGLTVIGIAAGTAAAPVLAVVGLGYGLWSLTVGDAFIDREWGYKPKKP